VVLFDKSRNKELRKTEDWDFVLNVDSWDKYDTLIDALKECGFNKKNKDSSTLYFEKVKVDLSPVGGVADKDGRIRCPGENGDGLCGIGYLEAFDTAQEIAITEGLSLYLPVLPVFLALKLIAWNDRKEKNILKMLCICLNSMRPMRMRKLSMRILKQILR
jgi:predicted nucleotidyltransferase